MEDTFEPTVSHLIHLFGVCIEIFGVFIIVAGIVWSTILVARQRHIERHYDQYKIRIGRSLLLGLEVALKPRRFPPGRHAQPLRFVDAIGCSMVVWRYSFASKTVTCGPGYLFFISCAAFSAASYVPNPDLSCRSTAT